MKVEYNRNRASGMDCRVVSFRADGDELELIVDALKKTCPVPTAAAVVVTDPKLEGK
jgi:hypothetical protein